MFNVSVDADKCMGEEECLEVCPVDVFEVYNGKVMAVNGEECLGCESCLDVCEGEAITILEV